MSTRIIVNGKNYTVDSTLSDQEIGEEKITEYLKIY